MIINNLSRKELRKLCQEIKGNITNKITPGLLTRRQEAKDEMNAIKEILLNALDASNKELKMVKKSKKEKLSKKEPETTLHIKRSKTESDILKDMEDSDLDDGIWKQHALETITKSDPTQPRETDMVRQTFNRIKMY